MRYSTPTIFFKYLQYYWVAANSKGHGVHSPFVYQFIRDTLNASNTIKEIEQKEPAVTKMLQAIENASTSQLAPKITLLIARLLQNWNPLTYSVIGDKNQFENDSTFNTNQSIESIDFAFIGEGQDETTMLENVNKLIDKMHANSWVILHGIHTDSNMEAAWKQLKQHVKIRLTIDLFSIGILFCRKAQKEKEHFIIRY
jgi:tRNA A-37 threonylcarbamoyl transferase component Bud32